MTLFTYSTVNGFEVLFKKLTRPVTESFGVVLTLALKVLALTPVDLARAIGVGPCTVCHWQNGESLPSVVTQKAVLRWLYRRALYKVRIDGNVLPSSLRSGEDPY